MKMQFKMLFDEEYLCHMISFSELDDLLDLVKHMDSFDFNYAIGTEEISRLNELLYDHARNSCVKELSLWMRRHRFEYLEEVAIGALLHELEQCEEKESRNEIDILRRRQSAFFCLEMHLLMLSEGNTLRRVSNDVCFKKVMTVFGLGVELLSDFVPFITHLFQNLLFDDADAIQASMEKLDLGFEARRAEILEHLFVLDRELPGLLQQTGLSNAEIGKRLTVECSPERKREIVQRYLTKNADGGRKFSCELHTKMEKVGNRPPDRIYFCAKVPSEIKLNGEDIGGRTFIYQISHHVQN